jgi:hypothetical protein
MTIKHLSTLLFMAIGCTAITACEAPTEDSDSGSGAISGASQLAWNEAVTQKIKRSAKLPMLEPQTWTKHEPHWTCGRPEAGERNDSLLNVGPYRDPDFVIEGTDLVPYYDTNGKHNLQGNHFYIETTFDQSKVNLNTVYYGETVGKMVKRVCHLVTETRNPVEDALGGLSLGTLKVSRVCLESKTEQQKPDLSRCAHVEPEVKIKYVKAWNESVTGTVDRPLEADRRYSFGVFKKSTISEKDKPLDVHWVCGKVNKVEKWNPVEKEFRDRLDWYLEVSEKPYYAAWNGGGGTASRIVFGSSYAAGNHYEFNERKLDALNGKEACVLVEGIQPGGGDGAVSAKKVCPHDRDGKPKLGLFAGCVTGS